MSRIRMLNERHVLRTSKDMTPRPQRSPWDIGLAYWHQRDLYTTSSSTDWDGYARGPNVHPKEGSHVYRRPPAQPEKPDDNGASLYEREAWPWLNYKQAEPPTEEPVPDGLVLSHVATALANREDLDDSDIEVHVKNGAVTLEGTVVDLRSKRAAGELAGEIVEVVHNNLEIRSDDPTDANVAFVLPLAMLG